MQANTTSEIVREPAATARGYSTWYVVLAALFVTCLITANIMAVKIVALPLGLVVPAGIVIFPLSYLFGDVLTEVYGYGAARRIIWLGFGCNLLAVVAFTIGGLLPAPQFAQAQSGRSRILRCWAARHRSCWRPRSAPTWWANSSTHSCSHALRLRRVVAGCGPAPSAQR